jgi:hypothetical protein
MTPEELRALDPDTAIERAASYLGVPKSVVWNQWTQESGRGQALRGQEVPGRGQAKGHFQAMDDVRAMFEKKHPEVKNLNLDNFGDALYLYARHMEENLQRTKGDVPEAVLGYFAGWDPKQRGKHAEEYLKRVVYGQGPADKGFIAADTMPTRTTAPAPMFRGMTPKAPTAASAPVKAPPATTPAPAPTEAAPVAPEGFIDQTLAADKLLAQDAENLGYKTLDRIFGNTPDIDGPTDYYEQNQGTLEKDLINEHEVESLREMRFAGKTAILLRREELIARRSADQALGDLPLLSVIAGSLTASRNSPRDMALAAATVGISAAAGATLRATRAGIAAGVAKQASLAGRVAVAISPAQRLAAANRPLAAFGAAVGEQVLTDTAIVALDDTLGRVHKTAGDYMMEVGASAALGSALELVSLPATLRDAKASRLLDRAAESADELRAQAIHTESDSATVHADDTAVDTATVTTDADAIAVNTAATPEAPGRRIGGDAGLERILREADRAEEEALLAKPIEGEPAQSMATVADQKLPGIRKEHETENPFYFDKLTGDKRDWLARNDPQWVGNVAAIGEGWRQQDFDDIPAGVVVRPGVDTTPALRPAAKAIQDLAAQFLPDSKIVIGKLDATSPFITGSMSKAGLSKEVPNGMVISAGNKHVIGLSPNNPTRALLTGIHELSHAIVHENLSKVPPELMTRIRKQYDDFRVSAIAGSARARFERFHVGSDSVVDETGALRGGLPDNRYVMSFDEWAAEGGVRFVQGKAQSGATDLKFDAGVKALLKSLWDKVKSLWEKAIAKGYLAKDTPLDEFFQRVLDRSLLAADDAMPAGEVTYLDAGLIANFSVTSAQARNFSDQLNAAAEAQLQANPIDESKLNVLAAMAPERMGALTAGLQLARSKTPVLRRMAQLLTETTTGAAGRDSTVAIRRDTLVRNLTSDSLQQYTDLADRWAVNQGISVKDRWFTGEARRRFDKEVTLYQRRVREVQAGKRANTAPPEVVKAAEAMQALYQRAADAERQAGTIGSDKLPASSLGYAPQRIDPGKLAAATADELKKIRSTLSEFWQKTNEWDASFSSKLADLYIDRARSRALGDDSYGAKTVDSQGIGDVRKAVKGLLEAGSVTQEQAAKAMERLESNDKRGLKSHRERLDIPMFANIGPGKQMVDFFVTDQVNLAHRHVQSAAGEIALTEMGIPGEAGLERIRLAAVNATPAPSRADMRAFDQVAGELFGRSPPDAKYSELAQSVRLMTSVLKLGGVVFNQLAETSNVIHAFGMRAALQQVASLPGLLMQVHQLKKGGVQPGHTLLSAFEADGAEIGMGDYRLNFPLRASDDLLREYTESPGMVNVLLKAGAMAQHKLSFMRGVHAAQHRGVAELILKKSARFLSEWDGVSEVPKRLQDMGFTQDLATKAKAKLGDVAVFNNGRLVSFDAQKLGDQATIEAYTQAIHRGTKQIIQGTFVGERNAWVHNDYMNVLTQFRTFSITALEKQWARQRLTYDNQAVGYAYLAGLITAQSAAALPIYAARVYSQAMLMDEEKREAYIDSRMNGPALVRGLMNYSSSSGALGDMMEYALMFGGKSAGMDGARGAGQADVVGSAVPAAGAANQAARALGGAVEGALDDKDDNVHVDRVLKTLPFSSLWYVTPFINAAK